MRTAGAALVGITCLMGLAPSAQADTTDNYACATGEFCLFEHDNFNQSGVKVQFPIKGFCRNMTGVANNMASSMVNNSSKIVWLFDRANCAGTRGYTAAPESEDKDFTNNGWDNKTSSVL
ncbi:MULTISPECIES: peptidase inhibitor family I36 protein [unclassified Nonomuraea]|uniref:peptidase inhibitor family I36 protein n=1 Tax=unclassified Nonomuraea TaxID=2593643 RepID=UPI0033E3AE5A